MNEISSRKLPSLIQYTDNSPRQFHRLIKRSPLLLEHSVRPSTRHKRLVSQLENSIPLCAMQILDYRLRLRTAINNQSFSQPTSIRWMLSTTNRWFYYPNWCSELRTEINNNNTEKAKQNGQSQIDGSVRQIEIAKLEGGKGSTRLRAWNWTDRTRAKREYKIRVEYK